jgi:hypothetical protein
MAIHNHDRTVGCCLAVIPTAAETAKDTQTKGNKSHNKKYNPHGHLTKTCNQQISVDCSRSWPFITMIEALVVVWLLSRRLPIPPKTRKQRQQKPQ